MGAFVLGVLVGWLAEWLFYTIWVKAGEDDGDCSAIKAELELKNRQISSLQSQLSSVSEGKGSNAVTKSAASSSSKKATLSSKPSKLSQNTTTVKAVGKTASKSRTSAKAKPTSAKTSTAKKSPGIKKASAKTKTSSQTSARNTATPAKRNTKVGGDDFTKLSGIGPSMSAVLKNLGIDTFKKLADTDDDILRDMLEASGARMNNNKEAMDSWNEQATVAATGDFKALKAMQAGLKR